MFGTLVCFGIDGINQVHVILHSSYRNIYIWFWLHLKLDFLEFVNLDFVVVLKWSLWPCFVLEFAFGHVTV